MTERELLQSYLSKPAVQNALRVIRFAEGTERGGPDSYRVMFGGGLAPDLKKHPDKVIKGGGYSSAAAGAYQFMPPTWEAQAKALGLTDFGPQNQDIAAVRLMRNRLMPIGGLSTLEKEGFSPRVSAALAPEWASLPTESGQSYYGQPVKKLSELQKVYGKETTSSPKTSETAASKSFIDPQDLLAAFAGELLLKSPALQGSVLQAAMKDLSPVQRDVFSAQSLTPVSPYLSALTGVARLPGL